MAAGTPAQKSPLERQVDRQRFALAVVGRKALDFAHQRGFPGWEEFEAFLREAFPPSEQAPASADPPAGDAAPGSTAVGTGSNAAAKADKKTTGNPAARPGPAPTFDKAALAAMEANGVDEQLLVTFLFGDAGPARKVTAADVERYLNG